MCAMYQNCYIVNTKTMIKKHNLNTAFVLQRRIFCDMCYVSFPNLLVFFIQIHEQIADVQRRHERQLTEVQEKHREQVLELNEHSGEEVERQLAAFHKDMARKEEEFRKHAHELEMR